MKLKHFMLALVAMLSSFAFTANAQVAKVGNTEYATIDEAIAAWGNNTTLTLLSDVTLSDVVTLNSTEHHILDLGTYTMTAASGKNAIVIKACGTGDSERTAITIKADAANPGGINAGSKCVVYYKYADGGISGNDRPIIKIEGGVFTGSTSSWGTAGIYTIGTAARKCATLNISGGTFNCTINGSGKSKLIISGGVFNYSVGSQGDSTALRLISGGKFKTLGFMTADSNNTKFWFGTSMANSNVGLYVDDEGYLCVGGPVITELSPKYKAVASNATKWSSYLAYSSAATNGLYYTNADAAIKKHGAENVTVYEHVEVVEELDNNAAVKDFTPELPSGVVTFEVEAIDIEATAEATTKVTFNVEPKNASGQKVSNPTAEITFRLPVPAAWSGKANVYHEGTLLGAYTIKEENGAKFVEVTSESFSEFTVEAIVPTEVEVATLAELQAALADNSNELPIIITAQIEIPAGETVTINLNGKTVNSVFNGSSTTNHIYALSNKGTLTIQDSKGNGSINSRGIYNYGSLTLNAGAINAIDGNGGYAVNNQSGSTFVMNGGVVAATNEDDHQSSSGGYDATALKVPTGCTATLNGGTINNVCDFTYAIDAAGTLNIPETSAITVNGTHGAIAVSGGETTINAGTYTIPKDNYSRSDNVLYVSGGSLVVNGGTFIGDSDTASGGSCLYDAAGKAVVNGGTFKGSSGGDVWGTTGTTIKGGTFENLTEKQHIAAGYEMNENGEVVEVVKEVKVATLAELQAALADNSSELPIIITETIVIPEGETVVLDLNGKTVTRQDEANQYALRNLGDLTIKDTKGNGSINARGIYNGYGNGGANVATAKITVVNGTINAKGTNGGGAAIFNYGVADIQGGTFTSVASYAIALQTGSTMTIGENAIITGGINSWQSTLTITGGTISNDKSGKHVVYAGESAVTINGGTFHNNNSGNATIMASGSTAAVEITGGTFTLNIVDASSSYLIDATSSATYTISGGSFTGGIRAQGGTKYEIAGGTFTNEYGNYNVYEGGDINISGGTFTGSYAQKFATDNLAAGYELNADGTVAKASVAEVNGTKYASLEAAVAAAQSGDEIKLLADVTLDAATTLPAGITFNGNGKQINGTIVAAGDITFAGVTMAGDLDFAVGNTVVNIPAGASLQLNGSARMSIGFGTTFNIVGTIEDAKTADKATVVPSLVIPGASFSGAGVKFNVTKAYISVPSSYCSTSKTASGTFDFNITNSIWESAGKLAFEEQSVNAKVDFALVNSVLTTGSHLVFGTASGEEGVVIDNSLVNEGTSRQLENCGTMTIKNGSVVNGAVATSSNAKNPGTIIVENATYAVTGEFSGSDLGTGTLIIKKGATVSAGSITKANITVDAEGMAAGDEINLTANLSNLVGTLSVINNDKLEAKIVDGKVVLAAKPVAKIGEQGYATLNEAFAAATEGQTITILAGTLSEGTIKLPATLKNVTIKGAEGAELKDMTISAADGNSYSYIGLTFDGITFDNSRILLTGWRNGEETIENLTVTNCTFKNLNDDTNTAPIHINKDAAEAVKNFTFTNNVIDGATGGSKSGIYLQATGNVVVSGNVINNVSFRPYVIQVTTDDGIADNFTVTGNTFSGSAVGRAQGLGSNAEGTDNVNLVVSNNVFKGITDSQQICYWSFNAETTTADLSKNYYDIDIVANPSRIYYNGAAADNYALRDMNVFPIYTALNENGTINTESAFTPKFYIAKVGENSYETLSEAVAAAQAGDEIVLTADVKTTDGVVITDKNLTIDLNGKTYTVTEGASTNNRNFKINGTSVVTVKNGTMVAAGEYSSGAYGTIRTEGTANVTLTGLKLYNYRGNGLNIKACAGTTVTIENTEIYANYGGGIESAGGTIVVNDGVIVEQKGMYTAPYNSMAISVNGGGKVTVNGGTFSTECITAEEANNQGTSHGPWVAGVLNSGGTLIINGGTFSNDNFGENSLATAARGAILADTKAKVEIYGGTFNVLKNVIDIQNNLGDTNNNPSVLLVGGTYSADPRESAQYGSNLITLAEDYIAVENNGVWNVVKAAAKIGETPYTTLADAVAAAQAGDEIVLLSNVVLDETVTIAKSVTINGNGHKVTPANAETTYNSAFMVGDSGWGDDHGETITLNNIVFEGWNTNYGVVRAQGVTLAMDGCEFNGNSVSNAAYAVLSLNYTDATVKNTTFANNNERAIDVNYNADGSEAVVTIDGCTFDGNTTTGAGIIYKNAGDVKVKNSTFVNNTVSTNGNAATVYTGWGDGDEVSNCTFTGNTVITSHTSTKRFASAIFCDGCVVNGNVFGEGNTATRNGETISTIVAVGAYYGAADLSANYWGDAPEKGNQYTVEYTRNEVALNSYYKDAAKTDLYTFPVAKIGDVEYATLSAAFAAVTDDNQTVVICKNVTENLTGAYLRGNITTENDAKVTITLTNSDWVYCPYTFVVGENVTLNVNYGLFYYAGGSQIKGTVVTGAYYQRYAGTKLTINEPGSMTVTSETCIIRLTDGDANAGIYVVGDNNDETVGLNLSVAYFYQGMINAKDANIVTGTYWQTNETDGQGTANLVLDNSTLTVTVYDHPAKATGNSTVTLKNGSVLDARNGGFTYGDNARLSVDATSKIIGKNGALVELPVAKIGTTKYTSLQAAINAAAEGATITMISDCELTAQNAQELFKPAYNRESYCGISIPDDKAIVLDLNGCTVSYVDAYGDVDNVMVLNLGNLTINDSQGGGKLTYKPVAGASQYSKFYSTIFNCGTVTVNGGTVENTCETATDVTNAVDNHSRLSHEYGNDCVLIVNDGTLTGAAYYSIRQYTHYLEGVKNRVVINGGTFNNGIYMQHGESWYYANPSANRLNVDCGLTINGGTFNTNYEGASCVVSRLSNPDNNAWNIEINGGTFNAPIKLRVQRGVYYANGVSGATVPAEATGARNAEWLAKNGGFVKGGTFADAGSADDVTSNLASFVDASYKLIANADNTFSVVAKPSGSVTPAFTGATSIWGEGGGNARESLVVKLYSGETLLATASLNNIGGIINGNVYVSWNIPLNNTGNDEYWNVVWENYVTAETMPTKVVMVIDGEEVAENNFQLNSPDDLNKIYAAVADADGKFTQFCTTLAAAVNAAQDGNTITLLANITEDVTISKKVTIEGAGKTYTGKMTLKADATIKNVNFDGKGYNGYAVETRGANYVTIENCTAMDYGYGFVQLASATALTTVKNVTVSNMNYGVKVDYSGAVVLENVDMTANVAAVLNSNYGEKTITIKNSKLNILGTWKRNDTVKTTYVFEGENTVGQFITDAAIDNFTLAHDATLTAPEDLVVVPADSDCPGADYESVVYENGVYKVECSYIDELNLIDGQFDEFENQNVKIVGTLTYQRTFPTVWTPIYVPFEIPVAELAEQGFEVAYINGVRRDDKDYDGELDEFVMEIIYIHGGNANGSGKTLKANYPYFIKATSGVTQLNLELNDVTLYKSEDKSYDCTTMTEKFVITGNNRKMTSGEFGSNMYVVGQDKVTGETGWGTISNGSSLKPFRVYMTVTDRENMMPVEAIEFMSIAIRGEQREDGSTFIYDVEMDAQQPVDYIYDLQGRRVLEPQKGNLYIINGKKVIF